MKSKNCLVTGGAGFVGSHMVDRLIAEGHKVWVVDNLSTGNRNNVHPKANFVLADVNAGIPEHLYKVNFDWIFHYAATVGVKRTIEDPMSVLRDVEGFHHIVDLARKTKVKKIMFSSSSEVYGSPVEIPEREEGHVNAQLPYAIVKLYGEQVMKACYEKFGIPTMSLRFFNVYGPRQDGSSYGFVVGVFMNQALSGECLTVFDDGSQTRDFVYINDNIEATIKGMEDPKTDGQIINIGCGRPITILDLAEKIIALSRNQKLKVVFFPGRGYEIKHRFPDVTKMRKLIDYKMKWTLDAGLSATFEDLKKKYEKKK